MSDPVRLLVCVLACVAVFAASAAAQTIRILPLGDSITHGAAYSQVNPTNFTGGYRAPLYDMLTNAGHTVEFVGTRTQNSTGMASPAHEGYPGYRISNWWNPNAAGILETVWTTLPKIANPHIILLHIGTNDSGDRPNETDPVDRLGLLLDRLVAFEPGAEIILSSLMYRTEASNWNWITNSFNAALPNLVATRRAKGEKIHFLDLQDCIDASGLSDNVHPNEQGYRLMAAKWFDAITNVVAGSWTPDDSLAVTYAVTNDSPTSLTFKMNGTMDATSVVDVSHYTLDGATPVASAALGSDGHTVTVTFAAPVTCDADHTLTVSGLANAAGTATLAATTIPFNVAARGLSAHVALADRRGYRKIASYEFPARANIGSSAIAYADDTRAEVGGFSRVGYYVELRTRGGALKWLWTTMDAYTDDVFKLGVPTLASGANFDCYVSNLVIRSNVAGITSGERDLGNIEFYPYNYTKEIGSFAVPGGDALTCDFDDSNAGSGNFGSMQIHDFQNRTTLFSWSGWGGLLGTSGHGYWASSMLGLGNAPSGHPDWTYIDTTGKSLSPGHGDQYDIAHLEVYVLENLGTDTTPPEPVSAVLSAARTVIDVTFDEAVSAEGLGNAFSLGKSGVRVLDATRSATNPKLVTLTLDQAADPTCLFLTVRNVRDVSPRANAISPEGVTITVTQGTSAATASTTVFAPRRAVAALDRSHVCVSCDSAVPSVYVDPARFALAGSVITRVAASPAEKRDVILTLAEPLAADAAYTLNVTCADGTTQALAFRTAPPAEPFLTTANIPECADYSLVNFLDIPISAAFSYWGADYTVDESRFDANISFDRVAYCLELVRASTGATNWVWVSLDPFTTDAAKIGVPTVERQIRFYGYVHNLNVVSHLTDGVMTLATTGTVAQGNIEFWPGNFGYGNGAGIPGASDSVFDFGDGTGAMTNGWSSMQIHNYLVRETLFSFNSYGLPGDNKKSVAVTTEMGIGNRPDSQHTDWISAANSGDFSVRHLSVYVRRTATATDTGVGPVTVLAPESVMARAGRACRFVAFASGAVRYQWRKGGAILPLETGAEYAFTASAEAAGSYDVLAYDADGNVTALPAATFTLDTSAEPASPAIRILPLGDSITWGYNVNGGYRAPLYDLLTGAGWNVSFCGSQTANSSGMTSPKHEGHSGYVLSNNYCPSKNGLLEGLPDWFALAENPHIVLLHAGTNDANDSPENLKNYGLANLSSLVDAVAAAQPGAEIVVTTLLPRDYHLQGTDGSYVVMTNTFNPGLPALVNAHRAKGQKVHFLDLNRSLTLADTADGVHPNATGYAKMAQGWFEGLTNMVPHVGAFVCDDTPAPVKTAVTHATVAFSFNEEMADAVRSLDNFTVSDPSVTVESAVLDSAHRTVTLTLAGVPAVGGRYAITLKGGVQNRAETASLLATTLWVDLPYDATAGVFTSDVGVIAGFRDRKEVDVTAGETLVQTNAVHQEGNSRILKTGAGTWRLPLTAFRQKQAFDIGVRDGTLQLEKGDLYPMAAQPTALLDKAALWLAAKNGDGARPASVVVSNGTDGATYVAKWCDMRETTPTSPTRFYAIPAWSDAAYTSLTGVPPTYEGTNGIPGVYFAGYQSGKCMTLQHNGAFKTISVIRDIFYVHGAYKSMGYVMANADRSNTAGYKNSYITTPSASFSGNCSIWAHQLETGPGRTGWTFLDGEFIENPYRVNHPVGTHLVSVKSEQTDGYLSGFYNNQFYQNRQGGDYLNEVIVFTNELTVSERASVTRYLMQKWGIAPEPGAAGGTLEMAEGATAQLTVATDETAPSVTVSGAGTFEKTGAGGMTLARENFVGNVRLAGGSLAAADLGSVNLKLAAGDAVTEARGLEQETLTHAAAAAGTARVAAGTRVWASGVADDVSTLQVTSGTLVLAAPRKAAYGALAPGYDPVVTNGTFETNSGRNDVFPDNGELYGWWRSGGVGGNIWKLDPANYPFGKLQYMASDSTWFLNSQGDDSYIYTRVRIDRAGIYEFSFDCGAREGYDRYLCTIKVGTSLDTLVDLAAFKTQYWSGFVRASFRTPLIQPGTYLIGFRGDALDSMASQGGGALYDNVRFTFVSETEEPDVWKIPNGDFEKLTYVRTTGSQPTVIDYRNTAEGWTFDNGSFADAAQDPYAAVLTHGMHNHSSNHMPYVPDAGAKGMTRLFLVGTVGAARTTFRPPAGTWQLRGDLGACTIYFANRSSPWNWNHTSAKIAMSVTMGGVTTDLGTVSHWSLVPSSHVWPTTFTADGATDVTLAIRCDDGEYGSGLVDNLVLVRVDSAAQDYEYVRDGGFEAAAQSAWDAEINSAYWRTVQNNVGQKYSYVYPATYATYFPSNMGYTQYEGAQYAIVCGSAYLEQDLTFEAGGAYTFTMHTASRYEEGSKSTAPGCNPLRVWVYPQGGDFATQAIEIGLFPCTTHPFITQTADFALPSAGTWTLRIQGQTTTANADKIARLDGVSVKKARYAAATPSLPRKLTLEVASGAKLELAYPGTNEIDRVSFAGVGASGYISARTTPSFISGPGTLYVRPKGTVFLFR